MRQHCDHLAHIEEVPFCHQLSSEPLRDYLVDRFGHHVKRPHQWFQTGTTRYWVQMISTWADFCPWSDWAEAKPANSPYNLFLERGVVAECKQVELEGAVWNEQVYQEVLDKAAINGYTRTHGQCCDKLKTCQTTWRWNHKGWRSAHRVRHTKCDIITSSATQNGPSELFINIHTEVIF